jgi:hypothetical protein
MIAAPAGSWNEDQREDTSRIACDAGRGAVPIVLSITMVQVLFCRCGRTVIAH